MRSLKFLVVFFLIHLSTTVWSQVKLDQKLPLDPSVKTGKLSNGLTYYIRKNSKPENKLELRLVVNAGSILEEDDQQGLAHFTEHMAFNGSKNFQKNDIVSFLQSIGVEFGADLNAYTGFDETVYILPIPTEKKENVDKAFQILEDWASAITFDADELEKERGIVLEEERRGRGAEERIFRVTYPKMFEGSKYANRLPIGKPEIIKSFKADVIRKFYNDWYRPDLMAVVAVGDYDPAELESLIKKHFSHLKNPVKPRARTYADVPPRKTSEGLVVTDREATNHVVEIYYAYQKEKERITVGDYRDYVLRVLVRNMISQRLQELSQKAEPPFIFGASSIGGWARGYEAYNSMAYLSKAGPEAAIKALVQENERARQYGFTEGELERLKKMMMKGMERAFNERDKTESSSLCDEYIQHFLTNEPAPGIELEYKYFQDFLPGITLEEVNKKAITLIPQANDPKLVILTGPDTADFKMPSGAELLQMAEAVSKGSLEPYEDKQLASTLIEKEPLPGKITGQSYHEKTNTTDLLLSNGIRVVLKPTDFKNDQVVLVASRFGGQFTFDVSKRPDIEYAASVVSQMGVGNFSPIDLRKFLAGKSVSVSPRIGSISESINGQSSAADIETMLQLVYLYFTAPRVDQELFNSFVAKQEAYYKNMKQDPEYIFQDSLYNILYRNHPWAPRLPSVETFSQLKLEEVIKVYKERFGNAYGFNFVLAGNFKIEEIKPLVEKYLASLPSEKYEPNVKDVGLRPVKGVVKKEIRKGKEEKSMIRLLWNGEAAYNERDNLVLSAMVDILNIKITESLREEISGMYSGDVYGSLNKYPYHNYSIGMALPCGPDNVDRLINAALTEIEKLKTSGPLESDLKKVKETKRQQYLVEIKENPFWARKLLQSLELGNPREEILTVEAQYQSITAAEIKEAANRFFNMKNYIQVVLNPE